MAPAAPLADFESMGVALWSFLYLGVRQALGLAVLRRRRDEAAKDVQLLRLHHQVAILRRQVPGRVACRPADRALLAALAGCCPDPLEHAAGHPATLLRWHRDLAGRRWRRWGSAGDSVGTATAG